MAHHGPARVAWCMAKPGGDGDGGLRVALFRFAWYILRLSTWEGNHVFADLVAGLARVWGRNRRNVRKVWKVSTVRRGHR
jgi:hypothetical protein